MSRSNKEGRLNHSGMTVATGHGGLKRNMMDAGRGVKPKDSSSGVDGRKKAEQKSKAPKAAAAAKPAETEDEDMSGTGIQKIGKAGASMVKTYKSKNA